MMMHLHSGFLNGTLAEVEEQSGVIIPYYMLRSRLQNPDIAHAHHYSNVVARLELAYSKQDRQANNPYTTYCDYANRNTGIWSINII